MASSGADSAGNGRSHGHGRSRCRSRDRSRRGCRGRSANHPSDPSHDATRHTHVRRRRLGPEPPCPIGLRQLQQVRICATSIHFLSVRLMESAHTATACETFDGYRDGAKIICDADHILRRRLGSARFEVPEGVFERTRTICRFRQMDRRLRSAPAKRA